MVDVERIETRAINECLCTLMTMTTKKRLLKLALGFLPAHGAVRIYLANVRSGPRQSDGVRSNIVLADVSNVMSFF